MPNAYLKSLVGKTKYTLDQLEAKWDSAKDIAKKKGMREGSSSFYAYTMGIFKKMTSISSTTVPVELVRPKPLRYAIQTYKHGEYSVYAEGDDLQNLLFQVNFLNRPKGVDKIVAVDTSFSPEKELAVYGDTDPITKMRIRGYAWFSVAEEAKQFCDL